MDPLSWRQRQRVAPVEKRLREQFIEITKLRVESTEHGAQSAEEPGVVRLLSIAINIDDLVLSEDKSFLRFLCTILTPCDVTRWSPECVEPNLETMAEITEDVQAEVMQSFLSRNPGSMRFGPNASMIS